MTKVNLILLGDSGVGKSTLLLRFKTGQFKGTEVTHGVEFHVKKVYFEGKEVAIFIWDTAGLERYNPIVRSYYRQGEGVLLVYDVTNANSFYKLSTWLQQLREINDNAEILIAGNKNENPEKISVAASMVKKFARDENLEYIDMSAKSGQNVEEAFLYLAKKVLIAKGVLTDQHTSLSTTELTSIRDASEDTDNRIQLKKAPSSTQSTTKGGCC